MERRDMMIPICGLLGEAAAKVKEAPNVDDLERPEWQYAYQRGYERAKRREAAQRARERCSDDDA